MYECRIKENFKIKESKGKTKEQVISFALRHSSTFRMTSVLHFWTGKICTGVEGAGQWPDVDVFFSPGVSDVPSVDAGVVRDKMRGRRVRLD